MERFTILSIDFDFFQKVDKETISRCYPDGLDLPTEISTVAWSSHYFTKNQKELLDKVICDPDKLAEMKDILYRISDYDNVQKILVTNSHVHIYEFINKLMKENKMSKLKIHHIDMHHDMVNGNTNVDCGNWLGRISEEFDTEINWICNPVSKEMIPNTEKGKFLQNNMTQDLSIIDPEEINAIFMCRSDNWTPPHLDNDFNDLVNYLLNIRPLQIETSVKTPRNIQPYVDQFEKLAKSM